MSNQSDLAKSAAGFNGDPLSIDTANNRVGIGTSSPTSEITIGADTPQLDFYKNSSADVLANIRAETDAGTGGKLVFQTKRNGNTALDRMTIDDDGRVTMPYQPHGAWTQTLSATPSVSILRNNGPVSSVSVSSTGQNGTIGRFTAPVTGLYHFNVTTSQITAGSSNLLVVIYINGTLGGTYLTNAVPPVGEIIDMRSASNIQDGPAYSHAIYLSSSDYVEFSVYRITTGYTDSGNIICSAYLIG